MLQEIREDFEFIKGNVDGVLLFGSHAAGRADKRSDIDICLVGPKNEGVILKVFGMLGDKYDVKVFEDLPLYIKMDIIKNHKTIIGDEVALSYYFYKFRKVWRDVEPRIKKNRFASAKEMVMQRRAWLNGRKISQKA